MCKIIFLDVDGVLNGKNTITKSPDGYMGVEPDMIRALGEIVKQTGSEVVLSSDWKMDFNFYNSFCNMPDAVYLANALELEGIYLKGKTPDTAPYMREAEIVSYLLDHSEVEDYCILDDKWFGFADMEETDGHYINTGENGNGIFDAKIGHEECASDFTKKVFSIIEKIRLKGLDIPVLSGQEIEM